MPSNMLQLKDSSQKVNILIKLFKDLAELILDLIKLVVTEMFLEEALNNYKLL